jgi:hypothetical protein
MAKVSKQNAKDTVVAEGFEGRYQDLDGTTVGYETYGAHVDLAPLFVGLPGDRCQCPHWGLVAKGKVVFHYADGTTDTITAGETYHAPPGHTPELFPDTEVVEFSPTDELARTMDVITRNLEAG